MATHTIEHEVFTVRKSTCRTCGFIRTAGDICNGCGAGTKSRMRIRRGHPGSSQLVRHMGRQMEFYATKN